MAADEDAVGISRDVRNISPVRIMDNVAGVSVASNATWINTVDGEEWFWAEALHLTTQKVSGTVQLHMKLLLSWPLPETSTQWLWHPRPVQTVDGVSKLNY